MNLPLLGAFAGLGLVVNFFGSDDEDDFAGAFGFGFVFTGTTK